MNTGTEAAGGLDALVVGALASALSDADAGPFEQVSPGGLPRPPSTPEMPDFPTEGVSVSDLARLLESPHRALRGDQAAVERLGRVGARRDPIAAADPLPWGRDSVTYSTAAVSTGREAGIHWPELVAFRLSDEFPGGPFNPLAAGAHAADNAAPAAMFPAAAPDFVPHVRAPEWLLPTSTPLSMEGAEVPPWLALAERGADGSGRERVPEARAADPTAAPGASAGNTTVPSADASDPLPPWLIGSATAPDGRSAAPRRADARASHRGIRGDFPALDQEVHGHPLVWLDSAATTQKPRAVIDATSGFYERDNSNVHRGAHELAARATDAYEAARGKVQRFLHARSPKEIIFTDGATEAINLVAQSWGRHNLKTGDAILVTHLEHHSNIVPWMQLCESTGAVLRVIPVDEAGDVRLDAYEALLAELGRRARLVALTHVSNALGTIVPVAPMAAMAHRHGARVLVDGSQAVAHVPVDVQCLGADFYAFSGHKIYGPTGIGALYGREEMLEEMPPWQGGGSMIDDVTFERVRYAALPARFEAGTPNLAGAVGLGAALDYVEGIGRPNVFAHEQLLLATLLAGLSTVPGLALVGSPVARVGVVSFVMAGHTPQAIGQHLNRAGIAVRAGHHCAQPILRRFGHEATVRPSLGIYSDDSDVARLIEALRALSARAGSHERIEMASQSQGGRKSTPEDALAAGALRP